MVKASRSDARHALRIGPRRGNSSTSAVGESAIIKPDFEAKHWLALTGTTVDTPFLATLTAARSKSRSTPPPEDVIRNMRGFHCQIAYGDWTQEIVYAKVIESAIAAG